MVPRPSTACSPGRRSLPSSISRCRAWTEWNCLRRLRQKSDMPVIFLTSKDEEIDELFGLKMGADDFITKPFSQRLLVERVKAILRRAANREAAAAAAVRRRGQEPAADVQLRVRSSAASLSWTRNAIPAPGRASR